MLLPGSSSPTFPRAGKCSPRPGRCRSTEHAPGDINRKRLKLTRPCLWRRPYHALIPPTALPLPVPMHKSLPLAGASVTSSAPHIHGPKNITREHRRDFPGPLHLRTREPPPRVYAYLQIKDCHFLTYFGLMFNYLALLN